MTKIANFERAFTSMCGSYKGECACGKEYYNPRDDWDWEDGELDRLDADPNATAVEHTVGFVTFEGSYFAADCDCWQDRAERIADFLVAHREPIGEFFRLEQRRFELEAESFPDTNETTADAVLKGKTPSQDLTIEIQVGEYNQAIKDLGLAMAVFKRAVADAILVEPKKGDEPD